MTSCHVPRVTELTSWLRARYDELHMNAVVNWTKALKSDGTPLGGVPSIFGTSLQVHRP